MAETKSSMPVAEIAAGKLQGEQRAGVIAFHGVPYAAAPVGTLRFAAPQPVPAMVRHSRCIAACGKPAARTVAS